MEGRSAVVINGFNACRKGAKLTFKDTIVDNGMFEGLYVSLVFLDEKNHEIHVTKENFKDIRFT